METLGTLIGGGLAVVVLVLYGRRRGSLLQRLGIVDDTGEYKGILAAIVAGLLLFFAGWSVVSMVWR